MASKILIKDLKLKEEVETVLLLRRFQLLDAKDGKKYLSLLLSDATGELDCRVWQNAEVYAQNLEVQSIYRVKGKLNVFQGKKQFIIESLEKCADREYAREDFMIKAAQPAEEMYQQLKNLVLDLEDIYLRDLLNLILSDAEISRRLKIWQAGKTIHHAYPAGLLEHILSCTKLAVFLAPYYGVNKSYVVAGCILHDLCKIYELSDGDQIDYTEEGKLIGHLVKGLELVDRFAYKIQGFPHQMKMHLKHILLSHHGDFSYGSPKLPSTSEAYLVHLIDMMDSKMNAFEMIKRTDQSTGHWSQYVKHLDRLIYKEPLPTFTQKDEPHQARGERNKPPTKNAEIKQSLGKLLEDWKES